MHKLFQSDYPEYFEYLLNSVYSTCRSQGNGGVLEVPPFSSSVYKSTTHFGLSFEVDVPKVLNYLPNESATSVSLFR